MILLNYNWESVLLLAFTSFLVITDRAFSKKVRRELQMSLFLCLLLVMVDQHFQYNGYNNPSTMNNALLAFGFIMRPVVLYLLITISISKTDKFKAVMFVPLLLNVVFVVCGFYSLCFIPACIYAVVLIWFMGTTRSRREVADSVWSIVLCVMLLLAIAAEQILKNFVIVNNCICVITCTFYFYLVMRTYKKDRLTGLLIRHNLKFEMEDNISNTYDLALIDVDNFKLINDKYGHDKGDEVLVTIVNTTLKHLPKGCRMYRYGGDEFVVISTKVSTETLRDALESTNEELAALEYRMSYGIAVHEPGDASGKVVTVADKAMYENKRMIKSENIWDDMTGLFNLRGFLDELDHFRRTVNKEGHMVCLVGVDAERLSNINKAYGYAEGNLIITEIANCLKKCLHGRDFIGHLGSDEFVVAVECSDKEDNYLPIFMSQIQELLDSSSEISGKDYTVKLNIERIFIDLDDEESSEKHVNDLLYIKQEDKDSRRKNDLSESQEDYDEEEAALVEDILNNNRLQYAFQPIVSAKDGSIVAYESLMRSDTDTMISPIKILKYADHSKRSYDVEKLTFFNTLEKFSKISNVPNDVRIFVNSLPGHLLSDVDFDVLNSKYGHIFNRVVLEITEHRDIEDDALALLNTRREKYGLNLAIDDYGSGFSNTNNLLRYMPQVVKLDRMLITGIDRNPKKQFFVNSIISFAKDNDMFTLAEGVETESELKTVIKLGVDLIQGYVTAKPSIDVVTDIPDNIKKIIVNENLKVGTNQRVVYTAGERCTLSVVSLAMEDYTKINITTDVVTITGSNEYTADMIIKIKDNLDCRLTLSDVKLNSVDDKPCIELGENCNVTLYVEGTSKINAKGIYVPESSSLTIKGNGNLQVNVKGNDCYGIGADSQSQFGNIVFRHSGVISINVDGETCIGIGGGIATEKSKISMLSGTVNLNVACVSAIGIGSYTGDANIEIIDTELISVFRVSKGAVIGTLDGTQNITIRNFNMDMTGSGSNIAVIGTNGCAKGHISLASGGIKSKFSGHSVVFFGGNSGDINIDFSHANISIFGEGDFVTGIGSKTGEANVNIQECGIDLVINASSPVGFGAASRELKYIGPNSRIVINGNPEDIY